MSTIGSVVGRFRGSPGSTNRKIFAASAIIATIGFVVKLVSLANTAFIARFFGTTWENGCYTVAFLVPMTLGAILSGSLNQVLIPTYIEAREHEGEEAGNRLFTSMLAWNTAALLLLSGILVVTDRWWLPVIGSHFNALEMQTTRSLTRCMLPIVLISGFTSMWGAVLNARERFGIVAVGPIMQPAMAILFMIAFHSRWHIFALAYGTVLGSVMEAVLVGFTLFRTGHPMLPKWYGTTRYVSQVRAQYFACVAGAAVLNGTSMVDMAFAGSLSTTDVSRLNYGIKIPAVFVGLMLTAVGTAILPMFSQLVAKRDWVKLRHSIRTCTTYLFVGSVLVTLIVIALSPFIVQILFERGEFTHKSTQIVAYVQRLALLGAPVAITLVPVTRTFTALKANNIMSMVSVVSLILNVVADYVLLKLYGLAGIALATSVWMTMVGITLFSILYFYLLPKAERTLPPIPLNPGASNHPSEHTTALEVEVILEGSLTASETALLDPLESIE